jgi:hypothetical protein
MDSRYDGMIRRWLKVRVELSWRKVTGVCPGKIHLVFCPFLFLSLLPYCYDYQSASQTLATMMFCLASGPKQKIWPALD